jgi:hypothetical protein
LKKSNFTRSKLTSVTDLGKYMPREAIVWFSIKL